MQKALSAKSFVWKIMQKIDTQGYTMPAPIPDLSRNQTCHHYQARQPASAAAPAQIGSSCIQFPLPSEFASYGSEVRSKWT